MPTDPYNFQLHNYTLYRFDQVGGERRHGGVALYLSNDFTTQQIDLETDFQAVASTIYIHGRNIDICSIYIPPDYNNNELLQDLNNLVGQFHNPYILLGDFNAHNPVWWVEQAIDARGRIVEDFIDQQNLFLINTNQPTHFNISHNTESAIDLSLCSPCLAPWFEWKVDTDIYNSDHYPISLHFGFEVTGVPSFSPRWNLNKADWEKFTDLCEFQQTEHFDNPVEGINHITDSIITAATQCIPMTRPCKKGNPVPWWTNTVRRAIAKRKQAFRQYKRNPSEATLIARNRERANAQRVIRRAKRESCQTLLSSLTSSMPLSKVWELIRRLSGKRASATFPILQVPGSDQPISEPGDVVNCLAENVSYTSSTGRYKAGFLAQASRKFHINRDVFISDNQEEYNAPFTLLEFNDAINTSGNTSVGPDRLHYSFFRHLSEESKNFVLRTFNDLFASNSFPNSWKESIIVTILKPGKTRNNPKHYRPISMTSCLGKLLERMVSKRLTFFLEQQQILSKYQCGFRKQHSTMDHLVRLESDIRKGFFKKQHTTAIFLDIKNAYDMVFKPAVIYKIHKLGIKGNMAQYLSNFLSGNRLFRVKHRSIFSNTYEAETGLPQGSCLSPILFNIIIDDLFHDIPPGISYSLFADDSAIWCTTDDFDNGIQRLQIALNKVGQWSTKHGLEFSAEKSAMMIFSKFRRTAPERLPTLNNIDIPLVSHFKFLGVVLDTKLSMARHVKHLKVKCQRRQNLFRFLTSVPGANRSTLLRLYKALVLPIIEYGSIIYAGGSKTSLANIEPLQNHFLRIALGIMKTSPIHSLQVEANITPLHIRRIDLTMRYYVKIKQQPNHAAYKSISLLPHLHTTRTGLTMASRIRHYQREIDYVLPSISPLPPNRVTPWLLHPLLVSFLFATQKHTLLETEIQQAFLIYQENHPDYHFIYTDGSKTNDSTGVGVYSPDLAPIQKKLEQGISIYSAELYGIYLALTLIEHYHLQRACICSDSKSAIQSLTHAYSSHRIHNDIIQLHQKLVTDGTQITFLWIPGHSGIRGNEQADHHAKRALLLTHISDIPFDSTSIRTSVRSHCHALWQRTWNDVGAQSHLHPIKPVIGSWSSSNRPARQEEIVLSRLRIGHTYITHSFIYTGNRRPICPECGVVMTVEHLLIRCTKYDIARQPLHDHCAHQQDPLTLPVLLGDDSTILQLLFTYLRTTDIFSRL